MSSVNAYRVLIAVGVVVATVTGVLMKQGTEELGLFLAWGVLFALGMIAVSVGAKRERAARSQAVAEHGTTSDERLRPQHVLALAGALVILGGAVLVWQLTAGAGDGAAASAYPQEYVTAPAEQPAEEPAVAPQMTTQPEAFPSGAGEAAQAAADLDAFLGSLAAEDTAGRLQAVVEVWVNHGDVTTDPEVRRVFEDRYAEIYRDGGAETGLPDNFFAAVDYLAN